MSKSPTYEELKQRVNELEKTEKALRESEEKFSKAFQSSPITDRKRTEQALKKSEALFRTLAENSPNMIFINHKGRIVYTNNISEEIMGVTKDEFLAPDFNFLDLIDPKDRERVKSNFQRHLQGKDLAPYEYSLITKQGKIVEAIINTKIIDYVPMYGKFMQKPDG